MLQTVSNGTTKTGKRGIDGAKSKRKEKESMREIRTH